MVLESHGAVIRRAVREQPGRLQGKGWLSMRIPLLLTFVSTLAFGLQFLIFVYLYPSHRIRFFNYLVWAWGCFILSKGLRLAEVLPGVTADLSGADERRRRHRAVLHRGGGPRLPERLRHSPSRRGSRGTFALGGLWLGDLSQAHPLMRDGIGVVLGAAQFGAALAFWGRSASGVRYRGAGLLAISFALWAVHRAGRSSSTQSRGPPPTSASTPRSSASTSPRPSPSSSWCSTARAARCAR